MAGTRKAFALNNGASIPGIGFGTWKAKPDDAYESVKTALENGYRHIDTAFNYGNEGDIGRAIRDSGVPREDIFLTTKLWSTYHTRVEENLNLSLERLGVDYLDLYLMHWPIAMNPNGTPPMFPLLPDGSRDVDHDRHFASTWRDMEALPKAKARAIGVANFDIHNLEVLRKEGLPTPAVNQVEIHPYLPQKKLKEYCDSKGIHITAFSPLGSAGSDLQTEPSLIAIAERHSCDPAAVMLAWGLQSGHSVIPKSLTPSRIKSNLKAQDITLTDDEIKTVDALSKGLRYLNPPWGVPTFRDDD